MRVSGAPSAFIFDMDGVLVDSEGPSLRLLHQMLVEAGAEREFWQLRTLCGRPAGDLQRFLGECLVGDAAVDDFVRRYSEGKRVQLATGAVGVFPRAHEVLASLCNGPTTLAVATSTARDLALARLHHHDLVRYFDRIVTGDEVDAGKPAPDIFLRAAAVLGVAPSGCVVVEDSLAGVAAGRAAGMTVFAIASTFPAELLGDAHRVFDDMAALESFIREDPTLRTP